MGSTKSLSASQAVSRRTHTLYMHQQKVAADAAEVRPREVGRQNSVSAGPCLCSSQEGWSKTGLRMAFEMPPRLRLEERKVEVTGATNSRDSPAGNSRKGGSASLLGGYSVIQKGGVVC